MILIACIIVNFVRKVLQPFYRSFWYNRTINYKVDHDRLKNQDDIFLVQVHQEFDCSVSHTRSALNTKNEQGQERHQSGSQKDKLNPQNHFLLQQVQTNDTILTDLDAPTIKTPNIVQTEKSKPSGLQSEKKFQKKEIGEKSNCVLFTETEIPQIKFQKALHSPMIQSVRDLEKDIRISPLKVRAFQRNARKAEPGSDKERVLSFTNRNSLSLRQRFTNRIAAKEKEQLIEKLASESMSLNSPRKVTCDNGASEDGIQLEQQYDENYLLEKRYLKENDKPAICSTHHNPDCKTQNGNVVLDQKLERNNDVQFEDFFPTGSTFPSDNTEKTSLVHDRIISLNIDQCPIPNVSRKTGLISRSCGHHLSGLKVTPCSNQPRISRLNDCNMPSFTEERFNPNRSPEEHYHDCLKFSGYSVEQNLRSLRVSGFPETQGQPEAQVLHQLQGRPETQCFFVTEGFPEAQCLLKSNVLPETQGLPEAHSFPQAQCFKDAQAFPGDQNLSEAQSLPETISVPKTNIFPETKGLPEAEDFPEVKCLPEAQSFHDAQSFLETQSFHEAQSFPEFQRFLEVQRSPEAHSFRESQDFTEAIVPPETRGLPEALRSVLEAYGCCMEDEVGQNQSGKGSQYSSNEEKMQKEMTGENKGVGQDYPCNEVWSEGDKPAKSGQEDELELENGQVSGRGLMTTQNNLKSFQKNQVDNCKVSGEKRLITTQENFKSLNKNQFENSSVSVKILMDTENNNLVGCKKSKVVLGQKVISSQINKKLDPLSPTGCNTNYSPRMTFKDTVRQSGVSSSQTECGTERQSLAASPKSLARLRQVLFQADHSPNFSKKHQSPLPLRKHLNHQLKY